jgi:beta-ureidopropionase
VRIALGQTGWAGSYEPTVDKLEEVARAAAVHDAALVGFPELCTSPYFCAGGPADGYFEPVPGPTVDRMSLLAKELGLVIVVPLAERDREGRYNSAAVLDADGTLAGVYRKLHLPDHERDYFQPGDSGPAVFTTAAGRIGIAICWDRFFPDIWQNLVRQQAQLAVVPIASSDRPVNPGAARGIVTAIINRCDAPYSGGSTVMSPARSR